MAHIYVCFLWHMHQPFYKDLVTGEYKLPWTRMHALKDYYGMVKILGEFPDMRQTFNLVPSLIAQIEEYASGKAEDPFFRAALQPVEQMTEADQEFVLQYFFQANVSRIIQRYPRYAELFQSWAGVGRHFGRARRIFSLQAIRDLQVLSQLAWFDEEFLAADPDIRRLVAKERNYSQSDQVLLGQKQIEVIGRVIPVYREFAASGQIEVSTTPFYHPILPLLCDSDVAAVSHPYVPLPPRFSYPQDARDQLQRAREYMAAKINGATVGLWPSEGSVSDAALHLAAEAGFRWFASDNGVLGRTLGKTPDPALTYRPYVWRQNGHELNAIFRDHYLSDLVGFVYSRMGAAEAADHFMDQIRTNTGPILRSGRDALVPIILDGENAWEYYDLSGRPFLRELYRRITEEDNITAVTASEAFQRIEPDVLDRIFPGSWIGANFDVWIGSEEDNRAWEYLLKARQAYERAVTGGEAANVPEDRKRVAYEELLIAEGSDWNWWYGPEHESANRPEFDRLYRDHLANVYTALGLSPPEELSRPILKISVREFHQKPTGPVKAIVDGEVTSYFEWLGAGLYRVDNRSGAMHGQRFLVDELRYGSDGQSLYLRLDFVEKVELSKSAELRINLQAASSPKRQETWVLPLSGVSDGVESAYAKICEVKISLSAARLPIGADVQFQLSLWQEGLPMDALPPDGWIEFSTAEPVDWML